MKNTRRIKRWIPSVSFMDVAVHIPLLLMGGLLFMVGQNVVFGIEGSELHRSPFPKVPVAGWVLVYLALERLLPPVIRRRIDLGKKVVMNKIIGIIKGYKSQALGGNG